MRDKRFFLVAGLVLLAAVSYLPLAAQEEQPRMEQPQEETKYTNDSVGRVSFLEGKAFIQRAADIGYEEAVVNDPVAEGDRLGTAEGRLEIQFGRRNYLRLDNDTKLDVMNLPRKDNDLIRFRIWSGHVYFAINNLNREKGIEIHTPDSSFYVLEKGIFRIDVEEGRGTEILVFKGLVEAAGEQNSYLVKGEQRLEMAEGRFASRPAGFRPVADDGFDSWNQSRDQQTNRLYARRYLPEDLAEYEGELNQYGDWVYVAPYGYVWVPRGVDDDWRPYYYGRWVWVPLTGWTWVPYEPWGWVAFHYGRWHWALGVGWYWIPHYAWGPAWVSWWWDMDYFCWAPLGWYGYPVVVVNNVFYDRYNGHYPIHSRALVAVRKDQLRARDISRAALRPENLRAANLDKKITMTNRQLPFRPEGSKLTVEKLDGKRVLVRQDGQGPGLRPGSAGASGKFSGRRDSTSPEGLRPAGRAGEKPAPSSGDKGASVKPKNQSGEKGSSSAKPSKSTPASGKVTPKKIQKKEDSPSPSASRSYGTSDSGRTIKTYPASSSISGRSVSRPSRNYESNYSTPGRSYSRPSTSAGRSNGSSLSRPYSAPRSERYAPSRLSSPRITSSPSRSGSSSYRSGSGSRIGSSGSGSSRIGSSSSGSRSSGSSRGSSSSRSGSVSRKK